MNNKDIAILSILEQDARISFSLLGEQVGVSKTPCWNRVKNLQEKGVICGYSALIAPTTIGLNIRALVHVVVDFAQYRAFEKGINLHPSVRSCHAVTGEFDYVLEILARDVEHFDQLLRGELSRLPGVMRFNTSISTRMVKQNGLYTDML